ncbi:unnamed protein product [Pylaiella littoralis]
MIYYKQTCPLITASCFVLMLFIPSGVGAFQFVPSRAATAGSAPPAYRPTAQLAVTASGRHQHQHGCCSQQHRHDHQQSFRHRSYTRATRRGSRGGGGGGGGGAVRRRCVTSTGAGVVQCSEEAAALPPPYHQQQVVTAWQYEGSAVDVPWRALGDMLFEMGACSCSMFVGKEVEEGGGGEAQTKHGSRAVGAAAPEEEGREAMLTFILPAGESLWVDVGGVLKAACELAGVRDGCFESLDWEEGPVECGDQWEATRSYGGFDTIVMRRLQISPVQRDETVPLPTSGCRSLRQVKLLEGQGWGDGEHPSTWLCLDFIETAIKGGEEVVDLGTGSGVLAAAAAVLGAKRVVAIDIDVEILIHARQNFLLNGVGDKVSALHSREVSIGDLSAEVVVANLIAGPMRRQMAALVLAVKEGGSLCLSGLRPSDVPLIRNEFGKYMDWDDDLEATRKRAPWGEFVRLVGVSKPGLNAGGALRVELERDLSDVAVS